MYKNLNEYTEKTYNKSIAMNTKQQNCPVCGHKTFNLYGDDLKQGKCFHPSCGLHLNLNKINYGTNYLNVILGRFFEASHDYFFSFTNQEKFHQPYIYAKDTRKIPYEVLKISDVGMVPPDYNVEKENEDLITEIKEKIDKETDIEQKEKYEKGLNALSTYMSDFQRNLDNSHDWFLSFYRDENNSFTQIKARKPYSRDFKILIKIQDKTGVFNKNIFKDMKKDAIPKKLQNKFCILEGEFDQLTFSTWCYENGLFFDSCALGGATGDIDTALTLAKGNALIIHDNDEAGRKVLEKAKEKGTVYGITTPGSIKDMDAFINSIKEKNKRTDEVLNILKNAKPYRRELRGIKTEVINLMKNSNIVNLDKCQLVALTIIKELLLRGKFFKDKNFSYIFIDDDKSIIPILASNERFKRLLNRMGVNAAKDYYNYVVNELSTYAFDNGARIETHNFCHYDRKNNILYISNNDIVVYKITPDNIEELENGDEGIMFNYKDDYEPFEFVKIDNTRDYFKEYIADSLVVDIDAGNLTSQEYKTLLFIWFLGTFFHSIMPSKVLLATIGEKGSRKTSVLRRLGILLFGSQYDVNSLPGKPEDFDTLVTNNHLVVFDNVDSGKSWLNDKLALVATGQTVEKRRLYTDNESVKFVTKTFLGLTSRTLQFTRDDVADRLICIPLLRMGDGEYGPEQDFIDGVVDNRNEIMSYIMLELQKILKAIATTKGKKYKTRFRIADFAVFGLRIYDSIGKKEEFESILDKVIESQKAFAVEEDSLVYVLKIFAKNQIQPHKMSGFELHKNLLQIANEDNFDIPEFRTKYKSVKSLTRRIANIKSNITSDVKITVYKERENKKSYKIELMDKDFELPPTNDSIFANGMEKAKNMTKTSLDDKGGKDE